MQYGAGSIPHPFLEYKLRAIVLLVIVYSAHFTGLLCAISLSVYVRLKNVEGVRGDDRSRWYMLGRLRKPAESAEERVRWGRLSSGVRRGLQYDLSRVRSAASSSHTLRSRKQMLDGFYGCYWRCGGSVSVSSKIALNRSVW